jgi:molybdopterin-guanine dinucleotide biosynthesis protein A
VEFDAIVLAGGSATRLGGADKMLVVVDGVRLIDRALAAAAGARSVIAVGPPRPDTSGVRWTQENPPGGGPVAALAAGMTAVETPAVVLLAADLPFVSSEHVARLLAALAAGRPEDGAMFTDPAGREQPLLSVWRVAALRRVLPADPHGQGLRRVLARLRVRRLPGGEDLVDCDTPADVDIARRRAAGAPQPSTEGTV